ncbi:MAG: E2/UBC family protein [Planctomycetota bacterium]
MITKPWWEIYPSVLKRELDALEQAGIKYAIDESILQKGVLCLHIETQAAGVLRVIFPDLYPYFRFEVYAPALNLSHHQNPFNKSLCLIGRSTENWKADDTLASFLIKRLPQVLHTGASNDPEEVKGIEEPQAEPFSDYYSYLQGTAVIVDGEWEIDTCHKSGVLKIGVDSLCTKLKGAVLEIYDEDGNILAQSDHRIHRSFSKYEFYARWVRLPEPIKSLNPGEQFKMLKEKDSHQHKITTHHIDGGELEIRAALFPEEVRNWRQVAYGWIFVCSFKPRKSWVVNQGKS